MSAKRNKIIGTLRYNNWNSGGPYDVTKVEDDHKGNTFYTATGKDEQGPLILAKSADSIFTPKGE